MRQSAGVSIEGEDVVRCMPDVRLVARRMVRNRADEDDLVQETCLRALENRHKLVIGSLDDLKRWLRTILFHLQCDRSRARRREVPIADADQWIAPSDEGPCSQWRLIDERQVASAVGRLPPLLRTPYVLFAQDGFSYTAISASLGIPKGTVGTRIRRARARLRKLLPPQDPRGPAAPARSPACDIPFPDDDLPIAKAS